MKQKLIIIGIILYVIFVTWFIFFQKTPEDKIIINNIPLSEYPHFRVVEVLYEIDTDGDDKFDTTFLWKRPVKNRIQNKGLTK